MISFVNCHFNLAFNKKVYCRAVSHEACIKLELTDMAMRQAEGVILGHLKKSLPAPGKNVGQMPTVKHL